MPLLKKVLITDHEAVIMDAVHLCVSSRGVKDTSTRTVTFHFSGKFQKEATKAELLKYV